MNISELKNRLLKNKKFAEEYNKSNLALEIGSMIVNARIKKGLTQKELAKLIKTQQPSIARLENGSDLPSLRFLEKIAIALKARLRPPSFDFSNVPKTDYFNFGTQGSYSEINVTPPNISLELLNSYEVHLGRIITK